MSESGINAAITKMRAELARRERATMAQMAHAYAGTIARLSNELTALEDALDAIYAAGEVPTVGRLYRMERYRSLLLQAEREFARYGSEVGQQLSRDARAVIAQAERDAGALALEALGPPPPGVDARALFTRLPADQIANMAGLTRTGPLAELLAQFGAFAAHDARAALIAGIALGEHPTRVARRLRDALNISLGRANTIARTEMLRTYRETHRRWYDANSRVVKGWVWHSALGRNTCAACWAMHGKEFALKVPMGTHPNCRCALVPKTKTWRELGFDVPAGQESSAAITPGPVLFDRLKPAEQLHILGPKAYGAYLDGEVSLGDFVHTRRSQDWGTTRSRASLKQARVQAMGR
jgi:phage putative head morphogenesis protein, SPP1 gp7 family